jgi:bifunctional DNA-binding transcriptional regulator/antitoxin component of YhaV-PrlF toxin-antitoxin module
MRTSAQKAVSEIEVGEKGQITMPASFRKAHRLAKGSRVFAVEVGGALMLLPEDDELGQLSRDIRDALARKGITIKQLHRDLPRIRKERFARLYGRH